MINLWRSRDCDFTVSIYLSGDNLYAYATGDVIRIKIGREGSQPLLELSSKAPTTNESSVSRANPTTVSLRAADVDTLKRGFYELEVSVVDDSDNDKIKHVQSHVVLVQDVQAGEVST